MRCVAPLRASLIRVDGVSTVRVGGRVRHDGRGDPRVYSDEYSESLFLRCGTCVTCLLHRSKQWAIRGMHERAMHERACFVTLTYDEGHLPYGGSLVKSHMQDFMRALRKKFEEPIRFLGSGEYGSRWGRPHYHLIIYGIDFFQDRFVAGRRHGQDVYRSPCLESVWKMGRSEIGSATFESCGYVAGYVSKKLGDRALVGREPEFLLCSRKPGLGASWFERYGESVVARDSVVVSGNEMQVPRYYDVLLERWSPVMYAELKARREAERLSRGADVDGTEARFGAIEEYMLAKVNLFARELDS